MEKIQKTETELYESMLNEREEKTKAVVKEVRRIVRQTIKENQK